MNPMLQGLIQILTPGNLLLILAATAGGLAIGALPGLTAVTAVALMVPLTFTMSPVSGLATLGGLYMSAVYGGCFSAILINTPGTPGSIATSFDGYPMARQGKGFKAIIGATLASAAGGLVGIVFLLFLAPPLARITLQFGPPEYFWMAIFGLTIMASMGEGKVLKTLIGGALGLLIGSVGITTMGGELRFGFGFYQMQAGINLTVAMIGLFCIPEALAMVGGAGALYDESIEVGRVRDVWKESLRDFWRGRLVVLQASLIGTVTGILPGAGGTIANLIAYNEARKISREKHLFGRGAYDGIMAPEAANNATVGSGLIPTLTLGIPGTPVAAIIYGALLMHGLKPGLELFEKNGDVVYSLIWALLISTLMMVAVGITVGTRLYKLISLVPRKYLAPFIMLLAITGAYAVRRSDLDIAVMFAMGILGYFFRKLDLSPGALVLGLILGTIAENAFVRSMLLSKGGGYWNVFVARPISLALILLSIFSFGWPLYASLKRKKSARGGQEEASARE